MTHEIERSVEIHATAAQVWRHLTDTSSYGEWNPFIRRLSGELREGAKLKAEIRPPGSKAMTFEPMVLRVRPGQELRWLGHLFVPRLFDGEHSFRIEETSLGRVRLTQAERFSGVLVRPLRRGLEKTARGFEEMNAALKERAEAAAA